jgi:hypothetical protein
MLYRCARRRSRNNFALFLIILGGFLLISFIIRSDPKATAVTSNEDSEPRLFCVLVQTQPTQERFIYLSNLTWAKHCHKIGIVRYRRLQIFDDGKLTGFDIFLYNKSMKS